MSKGRIKFNRSDKSTFNTTLDSMTVRSTPPHCFRHEGNIFKLLVLAEYKNLMYNSYKFQIQNEIFVTFVVILYSKFILTMLFL